MAKIDKPIQCHASGLWKVRIWTDYHVVDVHFTDYEDAETLIESLKKATSIITMD